MLCTQRSTRVYHLLEIRKWKINTYFLSANFIRDRFDLVVWKIKLGKHVSLPPVLNQLQVLESTDVSRKHLEATTLQIETASLLRSFEGCLDSFWWSRITSSLRSGCIARRLRCIIYIWIPLWSCNHNVSSATSEVIGCSRILLEKVWICLSSHSCFFVGWWFSAKRLCYLLFY